MGKLAFLYQYEQAKALQPASALDTRESVKHIHLFESTNRPPSILKHLNLGRLLLISRLKICFLMDLVTIQKSYEYLRLLG